MLAVKQSLKFIKMCRDTQQKNSYGIWSTDADKKIKKYKKNGVLINFFELEWKKNREKNWYDT